MKSTKKRPARTKSKRPPAGAKRRTVRAVRRDWETIDNLIAAAMRSADDRMSGKIRDIVRSELRMALARAAAEIRSDVGPLGEVLVSAEVARLYPRGASF